MTRKNAIQTIIFTLLALFASGTIFMLYKRRVSSIGLEQYFDTISEIAETIIPETSTPGARNAGAAGHIINIINSCLSIREKNVILFGLEDLEAYCLKQYALAFSNCAREQKIATLEYYQIKGRFSCSFLNKVKNKLIGPSFFELMKNLTVKAYCSSEIGATQGLAYEHVPVNYIACIPLSPDQRSWATA